MTITLRGHCPSKKNLLRRSKSGGMFRNTEVAKQIDDLTLQARSQWHQEPLQHPEMVVRLYVRDRKGDRDNKLTTVLDCLRDAGVIQNDNIKNFNGRLVVEPAQIDADERVVIEIAAAKEAGRL